MNHGMKINEIRELRERKSHENDSVTRYHSVR